MSGLIKFDGASLSEIFQMSETFAKSDFVPREDRGKPHNILVKWQYGHEIGLSPMQSLQSISVINGKPCVWGDALLALIQSRDDFEDIIEEVTDSKAICTIKRRGRNPIVREFSLEDAKKAGLIGKQGPWRQYPKRMMQMRARGFCIRDAYADALLGIITREEAQDYNIISGEKDITEVAKVTDINVIEDELNNCYDEDELKCVYKKYYIEYMKSGVSKEKVNLLTSIKDVNKKRIMENNGVDGISNEVTEEKEVYNG